MPSTTSPWLRSNRYSESFEHDGKYINCAGRKLTRSTVSIAGSRISETRRTMAT
jgi:hypothetical protein